MKIKLTVRQGILLQEALRRYCTFAEHGKGTLMQTLTGLGTKTEYKPVYDAGYMKPLGGRLTPRVLNWWVLTDKGAKIVQAWLDAGFTAKEVSWSSEFELAPATCRPEFSRLVPLTVEIPE